MSRGQYSIFTDLIEPLKPVVSGAIPNVKGRSKELISKRDKRMLYRYYFYAQLLRRQYDDCISILSEQFDISTIRVAECIIAKHSDLKKIASEKPQIKQLEQLYPWMNWKSECPKCGE